MDTSIHQCPFQDTLATNLKSSFINLDEKNKIGDATCTSITEHNLQEYVKSKDFYLSLKQAHAEHEDGKLYLCLTSKHMYGLTRGGPHEALNSMIR